MVADYQGGRDKGALGLLLRPRDRNRKYRRQGAGRPGCWHPLI
jgi:hypothetical protein